MTMHDFTIEAPEALASVSASGGTVLLTLTVRQGREWVTAAGGFSPDEAGNLAAILMAKAAEARAQSWAP